jgi:hypothetical protein
LALRRKEVAPPRASAEGPGLMSWIKGSLRRRMELRTRRAPGKARSHGPDKPETTQAALKG